MSHREECHRGGSGGGTGSLSPLVTPQQRRKQTDRWAGHPVTGGTLPPLLLSEAPHSRPTRPGRGGSGRRNTPLDVSHLKPFLGTTPVFHSTTLTITSTSHKKNWPTCLPTAASVTTHLSRRETKQDCHSWSLSRGLAGCRILTPSCRSECVREQRASVTKPPTTSRRYQPTDSPAANEAALPPILPRPAEQAPFPACPLCPMLILSTHNDGMPYRGRLRLVRYFFTLDNATKSL